MDWTEVEALAGLTLLTIRNRTFVVERVTPTAVYVLVGERRRRETVSRANLERAVALIVSGVALKGPGDYRFQVADERPAYAWAILRELGLVG